LKNSLNFADTAGAIAIPRGSSATVMCCRGALNTVLTETVQHGGTAAASSIWNCIGTMNTLRESSIVALHWAEKAVSRLP